MTDIVPVPNWGGVRQLETNEYATGGLNGNMNEQAKSLASQNMYSRLYAGLPFDPVFTAQVRGFPIGGRAALENGDIVRSTVANNIVDPNVDMTGWVKNNDASQIFDISGKNQQEININLGFWEGGLKSYIKFITYEALGAKFDGVTDDTAAIQAGNNLALAGYTVYAVTPNGRARITSTVTFYVSPGEINMGTCFLKPDRDTMTSGVAVKLKGPTYLYNYGGKVSINLIGPYGEVNEKPPTNSVPTSTLRGLEINGGTESQASSIDLYIKVLGFYENVYIGPRSTYLLRFHQPLTGKSWFRDWTFNCADNSGENISIWGGESFNNVNSTRTAVSVYVAPTGQFLDLYLYGWSQDYTDIDFEMYTGIIHKFGGHNENNSIKPYAILTYTNLMKKPELYLSNVMLDGANDVSQDAGNTGKPVWFKLSGGAVFEAIGGSWGRYSKMRNIKLIASSSQPLRATIEGVHFDTADNLDCIDYGDVNPLLNRDFSTGTLARWKDVYIGNDPQNKPTLSVTTHAKLTGNCLKISSAGAYGGTTTRVYQKLICRAGQRLHVSAKIAYNNFTSISGSAYIYYQFLDINGDEISRSRVGVEFNNLSNATSAEAITSSGAIRVPSGAVSVCVGVNHFQSSGDFYMGALQAFVQ